MKSAPASIEIIDACRTWSYEPSSAVSMITLRWASPQASFTRTISSITRVSSPDRNASREITMSISSAPAATASSVSRSLTSSEAWPDGNAVATEAAFTPVPSSDSRTTPTSEGYTHTAAQDGISGIVGAGQTALAHRWRTLPAVSAPSSVVRSVIDTASRMPCCFAVVLIERLPSSAARSSIPTRSTWGSRRITAQYAAMACVNLSRHLARCQLRLTSMPVPTEIATPDDPAEALAAVVALRRLADRLERAAVARAIDEGWTWRAGGGGARRDAAGRPQEARAPARVKNRGTDEAENPIQDVRTINELLTARGGPRAPRGRVPARRRAPAAYRPSSCPRARRGGRSSASAPTPTRFAPAVVAAAHGRPARDGHRRRRRRRRLRAADRPKPSRWYRAKRHAASAFQAAGGAAPATTAPG